MNETQLENLCLDWFREGGWDVLHGPDIAPETENAARKDYRGVLLESVLAQSIARLNPHLPSECSEQVIAHLKKPESLDLVANNRDFHRLLLQGVPVTFKKDGKLEHDHALLIDFDNVRNNRFQAINQFTITGTKQPRRPDIICFVNGLPLGVLELKSPVDETRAIWDAYNQIQTYKEEISDLFIYNEAVVISDGYNARIGSLTASQERFMPWRTVKDENDRPMVEWQLETMVRGFFDRALFLDYVRYFVLF